MPTITVENYVKQIYLAAQEIGRPEVPMGKVSAALGVVPGTATTMIKSLANLGLVQYEPWVGVRLTEKGRNLALQVLRRHRLIEIFLVEVLKMDWTEIHEEAEKLEHVISDRVLERIDEVLGHPTEDPHGDPIPTADGRLIDRKLESLVGCDVGERVRIAQIADQDPDFLGFVHNFGLVLGTELEVEDRNTAADSITLGFTNNRSITLGTTAAAKIFVENASSG